MPSTWFPQRGVSSRLLSLGLAALLAFAMLVFVPGAVGAADANDVIVPNCPFDGGGERIVVGGGFLLGAAPKVPNAVVVNTPVPQGVYRVSWASYDTHVQHPGQVTQTEEIWYLDAGGFTSDSTIDIPDEPIEYIEGVLPSYFVVGSDQSSVTLRHGGPAGKTNSVYPVCAALDPVPAPTLLLVKNVEGGNAVADDWTLSASAAQPNDDKNFSYAGGSGTPTTINANVDYTLAETGTPPNYEPGSWSCVIDAGTPVQGSTISLDYGQSAVCSITNTYVAPPAPQIAIDKVTNGTDGPEIPAGTDVLWTYTVTNTGNVPLSLISVTDDQGVTPIYQSGDTNNDTVLDLDEIWIYEATGTAISGFYDNVGTAEGTYEETTVTDTDRSGYFAYDPRITIDKVTNGSDGPFIPAGDPVIWTYTVTNTGNVAFSKIDVGDSDSGLTLTYQSGDTNNNEILDPLEAWVFTATGTAIVGRYDNTGSVRTGYAGQAIRATDDSWYFGSDPSIQIDKVTNGSDGPEIPAGTDVLWTYTVTNTGNVPLSLISVTDDQGVTPIYQSGDTNNDTVLDLDETWIYEATGTAIVGGYDNVGTAEGTYEETTVTATDDSWYLGVAVPAIDLVKTGTLDLGDDGVANPGDLVTYTFVVTNTGNVGLYGVDVTDPLKGLSAIVCGQGGSGDLVERFLQVALNYLTPGSSLECSATYPITQDDIDAGYVYNLATTSGTTSPEGGTEVTDTDPETVLIPQIISIDIEKATNGEDADDPTGPEILVGDPVTWTYVVTNTGNVTLTNVKVTDDQGVTPLYKSGDSDLDGDLGVDETWVYEASGTAAVGEYKNTGTVTGEYVVDDEESLIPTDSDLSHYLGVLPPVGDPLSIDKLVDNLDGTWVDIATYPKDQTTVTWQITVGNTSDSDTVYQVTLTDAVAPSCESALDDALTAKGWTDTDGGLIPAGESVTFECTENLPEGSGVINIAIADGVDPYGRTVPSVQDNATVGRVLANASIGDTVWSDENENGVQDNGEKGIAGATVRLTLPDGSVIETTTNSNGLYLFSALEAGTYTAEVVMSSIPKPSEGDLKLTTAGSFTIQLVDEQSYLDADFGVVATLPKTGLDTGAILMIALALLLAGATAVLVTRRKEDGEDALA